MCEIIHRGARLFEYVMLQMDLKKSRDGTSTGQYLSGRGLVLGARIEFDKPTKDGRDLTPRLLTGDGGCALLRRRQEFL